MLRFCSQSTHRSNWDLPTLKFSKTPFRAVRFSWPTVSLQNDLSNEIANGAACQMLTIELAAL